MVRPCEGQELRRNSEVRSGLASSGASLTVDGGSSSQEPLWTVLGGDSIVVLFLATGFRTPEMAIILQTDKKTSVDSSGV